MSELSQRYLAVQERINQACADAGRNCESVTLIGVAKTKPANAVAQAQRLGIQHVGENYLQEALQKIADLKHLEMTWHFIGTIQSNKTKDIAGSFDWVHTVDRSKIARRLNNHCQPGKRLNVLLQVNIDDDENKGGCPPEQLLPLLHDVSEQPNLQPRGLMAILNTSTDPRSGYEQVANWQRKLGEQLNKEQRKRWDTLSMGMTGDLEQAIAAGARMIRVGTALFGSRSQMP